MPTYVKIKKVLKYPQVIAGNARIGRLWRFLKKGTVAARFTPGPIGTSKTAGEVDVALPIPGVPTLKRRGRRTSAS